MGGTRNQLQGENFFSLLVLANPESPYSQEMVKLVTRLAKMYTIGLKLKLAG